MLRLGQRLGLLVVVLQHQLGHRVGHFEQQLIALLGGHVASADHLIEQDLDVHFMIRAIDAAGIVDEVGIARSAMQRVLDASQLGHAEVAALAHHFGAQIGTIDPHRIVGLVADFGVAFAAALHIGTDTAIP